MTQYNLPNWLREFRRDTVLSIRIAIFEQINKWLRNSIYIAVPSGKAIIITSYSGPNAFKPIWHIQLIFNEDLTINIHYLDLTESLIIDLHDPTSIKALKASIKNLLNIL